MTDQKPLLIVISGPTAVGKTKLTIDLANAFSAPIISADSRQIYKQLYIGVAKPSLNELKAAPHHLIGHVDISQKYSAGHFESEVLDLLANQLSNEKVLILSGGTGLYIKAVIEGLNDFPEASYSYWQSKLESEGLAYLQAALKDKDPEYYANVDLDNPRRLIRALSVIDAGGHTYSYYLKGQRKSRPFRTLKIALLRDRKELYQRIESRVDEMMEMGLLEEVQSLLPFQDRVSLQTVGYKELFLFLKGQMPLEDAIAKIKQHTRNYAKRQMTWLRNQDQWHIFHPDQVELIKSLIKSEL